MVLQEQYNLSESAAESIVDEVVQEAVAELRYDVQPLSTVETCSGIHDGEVIESLER